jgi:hypothetical protein
MFVSGASIMQASPHVVLLGDSILDNGSYTGGKPDVIAQVRGALGSSWKATLLARDGATTEGIPAQLAKLPADASHLVLSVGGNDALRQAGILDMPVKSSAQALLALADIAQQFESAYRQTLALCMKQSLPLVICTIYNGHFPDQRYQRQASTALAVLNDAIIRNAIEKNLKVIELRQVCNKPEDYANPIEPSSIGGAKIAKAIAMAVTEKEAIRRGAHIVADR